MAYKEKYPMTYHPDVLSGPFISGRNLPSDKWRSNHCLRKSDSIRCGRRSIINIQSQEHFLHQEGLEPWDMVLVLSLGAKVGRPEKTVVNIAGDGCFRMNMNEIATAARHNIPVIRGSDQ